MKCYEIMECLEELSPKRYAESWDNVGLLCGREEKEVSSVYIALDATKEIIEEAKGVGADMLLTHHPMIFKPLKQVSGHHFIGDKILTLAESGMCYYAMHTNFDVKGMADAVAEQLGLENQKVLTVTYADEHCQEGIGRVGALPVPMTLAECAEYVKNRCQVSHVKVYGMPAETIVMAAVCPGSGKGCIEDAVRLGADVLITGDIDHHEGLDSLEQGLAVIDAGHYGLEKIFVPYMEKYCRKKLPGLKIYTAPEKDPFWTA